MCFSILFLFNIRYRQVAGTIPEKINQLFDYKITVGSKQRSYNQRAKNLKSAIVLHTEINQCPFH